MLVAIDTATRYASLALHDGFRVRVEHTWESPRRHTVELLPRLVAALDQLGLGAGHLSGVAVTRGPLGLPGIPAFSIFGVPLSENWAYLILVMAMATITTVTISRIVGSPFGRVLRGIRED